MQSVGRKKLTSKQHIQKHKLDVESESETERATEAPSKSKFTLKQLIRKLHVVEPVENVMCLVGKRYVV